MFDGAKINLGGRDFIVPALSLGWIKRNKDLLNSIAIPIDGSIIPPDAVDAVLSTIHAALQRNYPDITIDELGDLIDLGNFAKVFRAIAGQSGLSEGGAAAGEPTSIGTISMPGSSPEPDGHGSTSTSS
ncbi:MAG: hypothetical protein ABFD81_19080 [Syntrophaceae bacterium]